MRARVRVRAESVSASASVSESSTVWIIALVSGYPMRNYLAKQKYEYANRF